MFVGTGVARVVGTVMISTDCVTAGVTGDEFDWAHPAIRRAGTMSTERKINLIWGKWKRFPIKVFKNNGQDSIKQH